MAELTIIFVVGAQTATLTKTFTDARALQFLDDLIVNFGDDPPLTRLQVGNKYVLKLMQGQIAWAKRLEQDRLDAGVTDATDLEGN